jgi:hypothetical protein
MTIEVNCPACGSDRNGHHHGDTRRCNDCDHVFDGTEQVAAPASANQINIDETRIWLREIETDYGSCDMLIDVCGYFRRVLDELECARGDLQQADTLIAQLRAELRDSNRDDHQAHINAHLSWLLDYKGKSLAGTVHPLYPERTTHEAEE